MRSSSPRMVRCMPLSAASRRPSTSLCSAQVCLWPCVLASAAPLLGLGTVSRGVGSRELWEFGAGPGGYHSRVHGCVCALRHRCHLWLLPGSSCGLLGPTRPFLKPCALRGSPCPMKPSPPGDCEPVLTPQPGGPGAEMCWTTRGPSIGSICSLLSSCSSP